MFIEGFYWRRFSGIFISFRHCTHVHTWTETLLTQTVFSFPHKRLSSGYYLFWGLIGDFITDLASERAFGFGFSCHFSVWFYSFGFSSIPLFLQCQLSHSGKEQQQELIPTGTSPDSLYSYRRNNVWVGVLAWWFSLGMANFVFLVLFP